LVRLSIGQIERYKEHKSRNIMLARAHMTPDQRNQYKIAKEINNKLKTWY
jgi:hypothetical protein